MKELLRDNIRNLVPYRCARDDFSGKAEVFVDANENWKQFVGQTQYNRYPDPASAALRKGIEEVMGLPFGMTVVGNGSDEIIDNLIRMFCNPGKDAIVIFPPTYGAYKVFADINDVASVELPLKEDFSLDMESLRKFCHTADSKYKLMFVCSPNNPSGNAHPLEQIEETCRLFKGIVVVDEAYVDFSEKGSARSLQSKYDNLVILRTFSKCWGLAGARIGILVASPELCAVMRSMKYPYNIGRPSQEVAVNCLLAADQVHKEMKAIIERRERYQQLYKTLSCVKEVYPSDANFLLVKTSDADSIWSYLAGKGIIVRNRTNQFGCSGCLRISIGSEEECRKTYEAIASWEA